MENKLFQVSHNGCVSSDHVAGSHTLGPKLGASSLIWYLAGLRRKVVSLFSRNLHQYLTRKYTCVKHASHSTD
jgi:hypothetical protein